MEVNQWMMYSLISSHTTQSLCFRIQKMIEVYRPEWCEAREDWSVYLFSPQNRQAPTIFLLNGFCLPVF